MKKFLVLSMTRLMAGSFAIAATKSEKAQLKAQVKAEKEALKAEKKHQKELAKELKNK